MKRSLLFASSLLLLFWLSNDACKHLPPDSGNGMQKLKHLLQRANSWAAFNLQVGSARCRKVAQNGQIVKLKRFSDGLIWVC